MAAVMKKIFKILLGSAAALVLIVGIYAAYVFLSYDRLDDCLNLEVKGSTGKTAGTEKEYKILTYNIGFGAYEQDYSFFMDGGKESRAFSPERLESNMKNIGDFLEGCGADFYLIQETDENATRTYHFNEREYLTSRMSEYVSVWAQNWDSAYLFYPVTKPHGKTVSGILTFSEYDINEALRRSLPVETGAVKIADLDRCYSVSRIAVDNGRELLLYNVHLSAYTSDGSIAVDQIEMLTEDMKSEYEKGNYVVCGGDFNKDLLGNSSEVFGVSGEDYTWDQPFPFEILSGTGLSLVTPDAESDPVPSTRITDKPYHEGQYVVLIDGFIVSDNVEVILTGVVNQEFEYSGHNAVTMVFKLKE